MLHRCKKCSEIFKVASVGGGETGNLKSNLRQQMLLLKCHCIFFMYGALAKKAFLWILKRWYIMAAALASQLFCIKFHCLTGSALA